MGGKVAYKDEAGIAAMPSLDHSSSSVGSVGSIQVEELNFFSFRTSDHVPPMNLTLQYFHEAYPQEF